MTIGDLGVLTTKEQFRVLSITPTAGPSCSNSGSSPPSSQFAGVKMIGSALATVDFAREGLLALILVIALALRGRAVAVYPVASPSCTQIGDPAEPAASDVVGWLARSAGSGARACIAWRHA